MAGIVVGLLILFFLGLFSSRKDEDNQADEYILYLEKWDKEHERDEKAGVWDEDEWIE